MDVGNKISQTGMSAPLIKSLPCIVGQTFLSAVGTDCPCESGGKYDPA